MVRDLDGTAAHDTARATAMTKHPSSRMSTVCSGGAPPRATIPMARRPNRATVGRHVSRQHGAGAQRMQGGDRRHESGFDGELCDYPHLADAEGEACPLMDA